MSYTPGQKVVKLVFLPGEFEALQLALQTATAALHQYHIFEKEEGILSQFRDRLNAYDPNKTSRG